MINEKLLNINTLKIVLLVVVTLVIFFVMNEGNRKREDASFVYIAGQKIKVEIADTPARQERGLSGREGLDEHEGMLFVFEKPGRYPFWMKDMNFPIDIIWLNENKEVIYIKKDAKPEDYPATYGGDPSAVKYVLEVVSGFSEKYHLKVGDKVEIIY